MEVPFDQQHDESVDRPNVPKRGMHGQSFTSSAPWDERAQHAHEVQQEEMPLPNQGETQSPDGVMAKKPPRGKHGESFTRSAPFDERHAKEVQQKMREMTTKEPSAPAQTDKEGEILINIDEETQPKGDIATVSASLKDQTPEAQPADDKPADTPVAPLPPKAEEEPSVQATGVGKKTVEKINNMVGATFGKVKGFMKK